MEVRVIINDSAKRKAIYGIITAVVAGMVAFDVITAEEVDSLISQAITLLTAATTLLAFLNTDANERD